MTMPSAIESRCDGDYRKAFYELGREYDKLFEQFKTVWSSRFLMVTHDDEGGVQLRQATEKMISESVDMADCYDDKAEFYYMNDAGQIVPLTFGKMDRADDPEAFHYGYTPMMAGDLVVGHVTHTDH